MPVCIEKELMPKCSQNRLNCFIHMESDMMNGRDKWTSYTATKGLQDPSSMAKIYRAQRRIASASQIKEFALRHQKTYIDDCIRKPDDNGARHAYRYLGTGSAPAAIINKYIDIRRKPTARFWDPMKPNVYAGASHVHQIMCWVKNSGIHSASPICPNETLSARSAWQQRVAENYSGIVKISSWFILTRIKCKNLMSSFIASKY